MKKVTIWPERCKACGYCVSNCPQHALFFSHQINGKGYRYIMVDDAKCVQCGICFHMCPDWAIEVGV